MYAGMEPYVLRWGREQRLAEVADVLDPVAVSAWDDPRADDLLARAEVLLTHWGAPLVDAGVLERAPELRMIAHGAGTLRGVVDPAVLAEGGPGRELRITSAASANAVPVAEYTLAVILMANKDAFGARERGRRGPGAPAADFPWVDRSALVGNLGRRIGVIGASHVGRHLIELLRPFELEVWVSDPFLADTEADELGVRLVELDELVASCHVVSIHAPELPSTYHLLDAERLAALRDGAVLINTARGSLVDTEALVAELASGRLSAVLDVTDPEPLPDDHPLRTLPNVFLTPHLAGSEGTELVRMTDLVLEEIARYAAGEPARFPVRPDDLTRIA